MSAATLAMLIGALLVGLTLGLLGSGGSILTVPVLVYVVGQPEKLAIAGSLAIVGSIAAAGLVPYAWQGKVSWRSVVGFGFPGMAGSWLGAYVSQWIPGAIQLGLFALIMFAAALLMAKPFAIDDAARQRAFWKLARDGFVVGILTGLLGVGGGFLIVPALVLLGGLSMHLAVGSSLAIITMNAASGFLGHLQLLRISDIDWQVIGIFISIGVIGSQIGNHLAGRIPQRRLRQVFAVFLVVTAAGILWREWPNFI